MDPSVTIRTSVRDFFHIVFKRKAQILFVFFGIFAAVGIFTLMAKPTYEAASLILVKIGRENLYVPTLPTSKSLVPVFQMNREEQISVEIEILKSQFLARKVIEFMGPATLFPDLDKRARGVTLARIGNGQAKGSKIEIGAIRLLESLKVEGIKKSNVIRVSFRHQDPQVAANVVNNLVKFYLDRHLEVHKTPQSYNFYLDQSEKLKSKLRKSEERLRAFKEEYDLTSLDEEQTLLLRQEAELRSGLNQTVSRIAETEKRLVQLRAQLTNTPKTVSQGEEIDHNPYLINTLQTRLVELELEEKKLLNKYTEENRFVQNVKAEIEMVTEKLMEQEKKRYGKSRYGLNMTHQNLQEEYFRNEAEVKALMAKRETQLSQLAHYQEKLEKLNLLEVELNQLQRETEVDRDNYRLYMTKFEESRISDAMDTEKIANVSLFEPARPPLDPISPKVLLNLILGLFLGGLAALGSAFFAEYLDDTMDRAEHVENYLKLPVLASIPELRR